MVISECNICGSEATRKAKIEGTVLDVCDKCVKFGEGEVTQTLDEVEDKKAVRVPQIEGLDTVLVKDFAKAVRKSREKMKLTQEELAKKLSVKSSIIKRMEEGWKPSDTLIDRVEKFFNISLREDAIEMVKEKRQKSKKLTIGDIVEIS